MDFSLKWAQNPILGLRAEVTNQLVADELDVETVIAANITTDKANLTNLITDIADVDNGVANTFTVNGTLTSTNLSSADTGGAATITSLNADAITSVGATFDSLNVTNKLTGDNLDYLQASIIDNLSTVEMVVNGDTNSPKVKTDTIGARNNAATAIDAATEFTGVVNANRMTIVGHINQIPTATTSFKQSLTVNDITSTGNSSANSLSTNFLNVARDSAVQGNFSVGGRATIDGSMNGDSFTFNRNFKASDVVVNDDITFNNGISISGKVLSNSTGLTLYENGQRLEERYLQKGDKAVNTEKLDGLTLDSFAQLDENNTFTQTQTFNNVSLSNASLRVGGFLIADRSGSLYERGVALSSIYETKSNLNSNKQQRVNELNSIRTDFINRANAINQVDGALIANLESKHSSNSSNINTLLSSSNVLKNASESSKTNALTAKNSVTSLVNSANSAYSKSYTFQTNKVTTKRESTTQTEWFGCPPDKVTRTEPYTVGGSCTYRGENGQWRYTNVKYGTVYRLSSSNQCVEFPNTVISYSSKVCQVDVSLPDM